MPGAFSGTRRALLGGGGYVGPLDLISNAVVAVSAGRRLKASYAGSFVTLNGGSVVTLLDQSGNARNYTNATADQQAAYVASGQNGRAAAAFDGSATGSLADRLTLPGGTLAGVLNGLAGATLYLVISNVTLAGTKYGNVLFAAYINTGGASMLWVNLRNDAGNEGKLLAGGRSQLADSFQEQISSAAISGAAVVCVTWDVAGDRIDIYGGVSGGGAVTFGASTFTKDSDGPVDLLGANTDGATPFAGRVYELLLYPAVHTPEQRAAIGGNLGGYYALPF